MRATLSLAGANTNKRVCSINSRCSAPAACGHGSNAARVRAWSTPPPKRSIRSGVHSPSWRSSSAASCDWRGRASAPARSRLRRRVLVGIGRARLIALLRFALLLPAQFFFLFCLFKAIALDALETVIRPKRHRRTPRDWQQFGARPSGAPQRGGCYCPCLSLGDRRNRLSRVAGACTRLLCCSIHVSASASVSNLLTVVGKVS